MLSFENLLTFQDQSYAHFWINDKKTPSMLCPSPQLLLSHGPITKVLPLLLKSLAADPVNLKVYHNHFSTWCRSASGRVFYYYADNLNSAGVPWFLNLLSIQKILPTPSSMIKSMMFHFQNQVCWCPSDIIRWPLNKNWCLFMSNMPCLFSITTNDTLCVFKHDQSQHGPFNQLSFATIWDIFALNLHHSHNWTNQNKPIKPCSPSFKCAKIPFSAPRQPLTFPFQHSRLVPTGGTEPHDPTQSSCCDSCNLLGYLPQPLQHPLTFACSYLM